MKAAEEEEEIYGINVTPLVDVCLVLVIIFMVTAPMFSDPLFKVELPISYTHEGKETEKITVSLSANGRIAIDEREVKNMKEYIPAMAESLAQSQERYVVFRADTDSYHGLLVELMYQTKKMGARSLTIATQKKER